MLELKKDALYDYFKEVLGYCEADVNSALEDVEGLDSEDLTKGIYKIDNMYIKTYTEEEATEAIKEYIQDSICYFNSSFLNNHIKVLNEEGIKAIQALYEEGNEALLQLIDDIDYLVEDAISKDGYGHFLNSYDGENYEYNGIIIVNEDA